MLSWRFFLLSFLSPSLSLCPFLVARSTRFSRLRAAPAQRLLYFRDRRLWAWLSALLSSLFFSFSFPRLAASLFFTCRIALPCDTPPNTPSTCRATPLGILAFSPPMPRFLWQRDASANAAHFFRRPLLFFFCRVGHFRRVLQRVGSLRRWQGCFRRRCACRGHLPSSLPLPPLAFADHSASLFYPARRRAVPDVSTPFFPRRPGTGTSPTMGSAFGKLFSGLFGKKEMRILMVRACGRLGAAALTALLDA